MPLRPCLDCGTPTSGTRCPTHRQAKARGREAQRPTRQARGYGIEHTKARALLLEQLPCQCAYGCGTTLHTPNELIAAHIQDGNPEYGWQPSCRRCNEQAKHH